jgi:hypothetical protein
MKLEDCPDKKGIKEVFPYWDEETKKCLWTEDYVIPDPKLASLLVEGSSIIKAVEMYLDAFLAQRPPDIKENTLEWQNHLFGLVSTIAELRS